MKTALSILVTFWISCPIAPAVDLPTVSVEHLYYLSARADYIRKFKSDAMIDYCIAQKIGGRGFEDLYARILILKTDLARLQQVEGLTVPDPRVVELTKTMDAYLPFLREEAMRVQNGILSEGEIARIALAAIGRNALGAVGRTENSN